MVCTLNNCFRRQKAEMNFTQINFKNKDNFKLIFSSYSTVFARTVTRFDILINFYHTFKISEGFNGITITLHIAQLCLPLS